MYESGAHMLIFSTSHVGAGARACLSKNPYGTNGTRTEISSKAIMPEAFKEKQKKVKKKRPFFRICEYFSHSDQISISLYKAKANNPIQRQLVKPDKSEIKKKDDSHPHLSP